MKRTIRSMQVAQQRDSVEAIAWRRKYDAAQAQMLAEFAVRYPFGLTSIEQAREALVWQAARLQELLS